MNGRTNLGQPTHRNDCPDRVGEQFPARGYLDTASAGLLPRASAVAVRAAVDRLHQGSADTGAWREVVESTRASYARLTNVTADVVAVGAQASTLVAVIAAGLAEGATVLTAQGDFTSLLFPFLARRGLQVHEVQLHEVVESIRADTALVAVSAVQSADGRLIDLTALADRADSLGVPVLVDLTQAAGWLPVDASRFAYTVASGYKWLLAPRGTAFLTVQPDLIDGLDPIHAGWFAGEDPWATTYGSPLRLADAARRFDVSPAWLSWIGAAPALDLLLSVGVDAVHHHASTLSRRFTDGLGLPPTGSAIVTVDADDRALAAVHAAGIRASRRAGRLRLSFHLSTTEDDVDAAVGALRGRSG